MRALPLRREPRRHPRLRHGARPRVARRISMRPPLKPSWVALALKLVVRSGPAVPVVDGGDVLDARARPFLEEAVQDDRQEDAVDEVAETYSGKVFVLKTVASFALAASPRACRVAGAPLFFQARGARPNPPRHKLRSQARPCPYHRGRKRPGRRRGGATCGARLPRRCGGDSPRGDHTSPERTAASSHDEQLAQLRTAPSGWARNEAHATMCARAGADYALGPTRRWSLLRAGNEDGAAQHSA